MHRLGVGAEPYLWVSYRPPGLEIPLSQWLKVRKGGGSRFCPVQTHRPNSTTLSHTQLPRAQVPSFQSGSGPVVNSCLMSLEGLPQNQPESASCGGLL